jgi:hypothetical protein
VSALCSLSVAKRLTTGLAIDTLFSLTVISAIKRLWSDPMFAPE